MLLYIYVNYFINFATVTGISVYTNHHNRTDNFSTQQNGNNNGNLAEP
jgi:hypothetical protein